MKKLSKFKFVILFALIIPTFWVMLKPGIFSMQDFPLFRMFEYEKCLLDFQFPCRWSPDVAFGYGQPLFNFYGQLVFLFGEFFRIFQIQFIDTIKILFALSFVLSGFTMFLLSRQLWKSDLAALISAIIYIYAPYRAVDVYVRGALPESYSFIFFPLTIYLFNRYIKNQKFINLLLFSLSLAGLILTHNLSVILFSPFLVTWVLYKLIRKKAWRILPNLLLSMLIAVGFTSTYLLPVIFESHLVTLEKTIEGYFDFRAHFVTLNQLLISRTWGYGGSTWGDQDNLSLAVGLIQWVLPVITLGLLLVTRKIKKYWKFLVIFSIGWLSLVLTHNKSAFIWELLNPMAYIQFPWRFLSIAVFCFALCSGLIVTLIDNLKIKIGLTIAIILATIFLNISFFREDLWFYTNDQEQFSGQKFVDQSAASINDYWPKSAEKTPTSFAPNNVTFIEGVGNGTITYKTSDKIGVALDVQSEKAKIQIPSVYFPGWEGYPSGELGVITLNVDNQTRDLTLKFTDTPIRIIGNIISLGTILLVTLLLLIPKFKKHAS